MRRAVWLYLALAACGIKGAPVAPQAGDTPVESAVQPPPKGSYATGTQMSVGNPDGGITDPSLR